VNSNPQIIQQVQEFLSAAVAVVDHLLDLDELGVVRQLQQHQDELLVDGVAQLPDVLANAAERIEHLDASDLRRCQLGDGLCALVVVVVQLLVQHLDLGCCVLAFLLQRIDRDGLLPRLVLKLLDGVLLFLELAKLMMLVLLRLVSNSVFQFRHLRFSLRYLDLQLRYLLLQLLNLAPSSIVNWLLLDLLLAHTECLNLVSELPHRELIVDAFILGYCVDVHTLRAAFM
jgi:hypothetical protein